MPPAVKGKPPAGHVFEKCMRLLEKGLFSRFLASFVPLAVASRPPVGLFADQAGWQSYM